MTNADENYYSLLGVDRDAPPGLIRESYRRLLQHAGNHPALGGDTRTAALINKAYAVLSDPAQRSEYDLRLEVLERVATGIEIEEAPRILDPTRECLFCEQPHDRVSEELPEIGCAACGSPLQAVATMRTETSDQRAVHRVGKTVDVTFFTDWPQAAGFVAKTTDISPHGLRMITQNHIRCGQRIRLISSVLDAVGDVTHCVSRRNGWRTEHVAGVAFLTLRILHAVGGFVSRRV